MYQVWWKRQGEWIRLLKTHNPEEARVYANTNISHAHITERIEIRDGTGVCETIFDSSW